MVFITYTTTTARSNRNREGARDYEMKHIQGRVTEEQHKALKRLSVETGKSMQTLMGEAVNNFLLDSNPQLTEEKHHGQEEPGRERC